MSEQELKKLAMKLLNISMEEIEENSGYIENLAVLFVSVPTKDGISVLLGSDGGILFGNSEYSFDRLLSEYQSGKRTPPDFFNN